ncbi:MAG TPA: hypothetical protein VMG30_03280 [Acidobacteriota bacterium]|nr:hypothetical protein [Acidobacteriota bacterium]
MKHTVTALMLVLVLAFCINGTIVQAQQGGLHAPSGGTRTITQSINVPPLPNAPFTATVSTSTIRKLDDGGTITLQNHRTIARDAAGRIYQERRNFLPAGDTSENIINQIELSDPLAHMLIMCHPSEQTCTISSYLRTPSPAHVIPTGPYADGAGDLAREALGDKIVNGVETVGTRETSTINASAFGNNNPIVVVKEFWYSPVLGINVIEKRQDPRFGDQSFAVSDITLGEPDMRLFQMPANFKVVDLRTPVGVSKANN